MPVTNTTSLAGPFTPNGSTTVFPFAFNAQLTSDVAVFDGDGALVSSALYTVALYEDDGGTVTFAAAPTSGDFPELFIALVPSFAQTADFTNAGPTYNPAQLTAALDSLATRIIALKGDVDRAVKAPLGDEPLSITEMQAIADAAPTLAANTAAADASAAAAATSASDAETAALIAQAITGPLYANTTLGLAATVDGEGFDVDNADGTVTVYLNDGGTAVEIRTIIIDPSAPGASAELGHIASGTGAVTRTVQAKLRDTVSPEDFGAVGDGVADDTAAFVAALTASNNVVCNPARTYLIGDVAIGTNKTVDGRFCRFVRKAGADRAFALSGFQPRLINFDILGTLGADTNAITTTNATASAGASAIVVTSATGIRAGMRIVVQSDFPGGVETHEVASLAGTTLTLRKVLRGNIASGARVLADFALVKVSGSGMLRARVENGTIRACLFGIELGDQITPGGNSFALLQGIQVSDYYGAAFIYTGRNAAGITTNWIANGGRISIANHTGNGATTVYAYTWRFSPKMHRGYDEPSIKVKVGGVTLGAPSEYTVNETTGQVTLAVAPANGAAIVLENFESACYGIVSDRLGAASPSSVEEISGGLAINQIHGIYLDNSDLAWIYNVRTDTNSFSGILMVGCRAVTVSDVDCLFTPFPIILGAGNDRVTLSFHGRLRPDVAELTVTPNKRGLTIAAGNSDVVVNSWRGEKSSNIATSSSVGFECATFFNCTTIGPVGSGVLTFVGQTGAGASEADRIFRVPSDGFIVGLICANEIAPGVGETVTYRVRKSFSDTALVATVAGADVFEAVAYAGAAIPVSRNESIGLKLETSAGAASARHQASILWMPR